MNASTNGEKLEADVQREISIPILRAPDRDKLIPVFRAEDLIDLDKRDRRVIEEMSIVHQQFAWVSGALLEANRHLRLLQADLIRLRLRYDRAVLDQTEDRLVIKILKWAANVAGAGIIAAIVLKLMHT